MPARTLTLRQINRATLARQMLLAREPISALTAIERLVALQAQWPRPPFVGLWSRVAGFERAHLTDLLARRKVVRGTFLRATIHLVSAKDYLAFRPAIQPALDGAMTAILKDRLAGVDLAALVKRAKGMLEKRPRTFEELRDEFLRADPKADERAMGYAVRMLLPLVQMPAPDAAWAFPAQASFAPAEQWLDRKIARGPGSPDQLLQRYLAAYGPASAADFQGWAGLSRGSVREAIDRLRPRLSEFRGDGKRELFDLESAPRPVEDVPAQVRFIPEYDNLVTARADERIVARQHRPRVFLSALRIAATVLVDGFAAATWKLQATKKSATIVIEPFGTLPARIRGEVTAEAEALARFAEPGAGAVDVKIAKS
jgi:Winged helix DNA-binding domain